MTERLASIAYILEIGARGVVFNCGACKRMVHRDPLGLAVDYGEDTRLDQIAARGRCEGCGVKGRLWFEILAAHSGRGGFSGVEKAGG